MIGGMSQEPNTIAGGTMRLRLLTPVQMTVDMPVRKIVAESLNGFFCLMPRHVDFLSALVPSLLVYEDEQSNERFAAVGEGTLVKRGREVLISTREAILSSDLQELRKVVRERFLELDERERAAHTAVAKLEASFLRGYLELVEESS